MKERESKARGEATPKSPGLTHRQEPFQAEGSAPTDTGMSELVERLRETYSERYKDEQPAAVIHVYETERSEAATRITELERRVEEARAALSDVLPYAIAAVGRPRCIWPTDSVILKAEAWLAAHLAPGKENPND